MKKLLLIALPAVALNLHAAEPGRSFKPGFEPGYLEVSIHDLPEGSAQDIGAALRQYTRNLDAGGSSPKAERPGRNDRDLQALVIYPKEHVYEVKNATLERKLDAKHLVTDYSSLMIEPLDLDATRPCRLVGTSTNGVYNRDTRQHSGFARVFACPDGDVLIRDMTFYKMRKTVIKEQRNVDLDGSNGAMHGMRDPHGNSFTSLSWVSGGVDHLVQKTGVEAATREWLIRYAREVMRKEAERQR